MDPFHILYLLTLFFIGTYFVILKPEIDGFSVAFGGATFYFLPLLLGHGEGIDGIYSIGKLTYVFGILFMVFLFFGDRIIPRFTFNINPSEQGHIKDLYIHILTLSTLFVLFILLLKFEIEWIMLAKARTPTPFSSNLLRLLAPVAVISSWISRYYKYTIINFIVLILFTVVFKVRSPIAMTVISILLFEAYIHSPTLFRRLRLIIIGGLGAFSILLFDKTKGRILRGEFEVLFDLDRNIRQVLWNNNSHIILDILNKTLIQQYQLPYPGVHLATNFLHIIPFAETLFNVPQSKYGKIIKPVFYSGREAGIGSNIWAETFAIAGLYGLFSVVLIYLIVLGFFSAQLNSETWVLRLFSFTILPYWAFFIHRLTLAAILSTTGSIAAITIGIYIIILILNEGVSKHHLLSSA